MVEVRGSVTRRVQAKAYCWEDSGFVHPEVEIYTILVSIFKKKNIYLQIKYSIGQRILIYNEEMDNELQILKKKPDRHHKHKFGKIIFLTTHLNNTFFPLYIFWVNTLQLLLHMTIISYESFQ